MLSYEQMPGNNAALAKIPVDFPHVPLDEVADPKEIEPYLLDYLKVEDYGPDSGDLKFLRTALVGKTVYWIWEFVTGGQKAYATATQDENGDTSVGCDTNDYNLTPEQYILADYHKCL